VRKKREEATVSAENFILNEDGLAGWIFLRETRFSSEG
jgi:hypothetical protein